MRSLWVILFIVSYLGSFGVQSRASIRAPIATVKITHSHETTEDHAQSHEHDHEHSSSSDSENTTDQAHDSHHKNSHSHSHEIVVGSAPSIVLTSQTPLLFKEIILMAYPAPIDSDSPPEPGLSSIFRPPIG